MAVLSGGSAAASLHSSTRRPITPAACDGRRVALQRVLQASQTRHLACFPFADIIYFRQGKLFLFVTLN